MNRFWSALILLLAWSSAATAGITPFPATFRTQDIAVNGTTIHVHVATARRVRVA